MLKRIILTVIWLRCCNISDVGSWLGLSSGHVTFLRGEFQLLKLSPNRTYDAGPTHVEL